jgi:2,4-dienoyl-CoA reductase-like NADH-dependent reductase (Old Yellow Enzyme family)
MRLARRHAPKAVILAKGGLHDVDHAVATLDDGADIVTMGRGALANPDLPKRLSSRSAPKAFDPAILGPIANIKEAELAL